MKRLALTLAVALVATFVVACGGDSGNGGNGNGDGNGNGGDGVTTATPKPPPSGANSVTVVITDDGFTIDQTEVANGLVSYTVRNEGTKKRSFYVISWDKPLEEVPIDDDNQVDVLLGGLRIAGHVADLPPGATKTQNIVTYPGQAVLFSNEPGDFVAGLRAVLTVN